MTESTRSGFVAVIGPPNSGKSTLINYLVGDAWLAVSPVPQTTLHVAEMILSEPRGQIILVDTAGLLPFREDFYRPVVAASLHAAFQADVVVRLLGDRKKDAFFDQIEHLLASRNIPLLRVQTRADLPNASAPDGVLSVSGISGEGVKLLLSRIFGSLPEGQALYPEDDLSTTPMRDFVVAWIRETLFLTLGQELPHSIFVDIEEYTMREDHSLFVRAALGVERESQKGMVIGKAGAKIREIGMTARKRISAGCGLPAHLKLFVKVRPDWRKNDTFVREFGVAMPSAEVNRYCSMVGI